VNLSSFLTCGVTTTTMPPKKSQLGRKTAKGYSAARNRQAESTEQCQARLAANQARNGAAREAETPEQRQARLAADQERHGAAREAETPAQRKARLAADQDRQHVSRRDEDQDRRSLRLAEAALHRTSLPSHTSFVIQPLAALNYQPKANYSGHPSVCIGPMTSICQFCKAMKFQNEPPGLCCAAGKVSIHTKNLVTLFEASHSVE